VRAFFIALHLEVYPGVSSDSAKVHHFDPHRTLNGVKVVRVWYNYSVEAICLISHEPDGLEASAGRGSVPQLMLYCIVLNHHACLHSRWNSS
jgi:hypothetical protein